MGLFKWIGNLFASKDNDLFVGWIVDDWRDPYKSAPWNKSDHIDSDEELLTDNDSGFLSSGIDDYDYSSVLGSDDLFEDDMDCPEINPANGLPMVGCSVDIEGNPYGTDFSHDDMFNNSTTGLFDDSLTGCDINSASGLPMIDDIGGFDVGGNPYGTDFSHDDMFSSTSDDTFSSFDDSFGSSSFSDDW